MCLLHLIFYQLFGVFLQAIIQLVFPTTHNEILSLLEVLANWLIKPSLKENSVESNCDKVSPWLCLSENTPEKCLSAVSIVLASEQPLLLPLKEWNGTNHLLPMVTTQCQSASNYKLVIFTTVTCLHSLQRVDLESYFYTLNEF